MKLSPAFGLLAISALALIGDTVAVLTGHGTVPLFDSVVIAGLTAGAGITVPGPAAKTTAVEPTSPTPGQ